MGKSRSPTYFRRLGRFLLLKGTKSSLVSIIYILKIINAYQDNVKYGKTVQMSDFISYAVSLLWVRLCYGILLRNVWRAH